jgi:hypothetical protein
VAANMAHLVDVTPWSVFVRLVLVVTKHKTQWVSHSCSSNNTGQTNGEMK